MVRPGSPTSLAANLPSLQASCRKVPQSTLLMNKAELCKHRITLEGGRRNKICPSSCNSCYSAHFKVSVISSPQASPCPWYEQHEDRSGLCPPHRPKPHVYLKVRHPNPLPQTHPEALINAISLYGLGVSRVRPRNLHSSSTPS